MPRLPLSLFRRARHVSRGTELLLPVCRDLASASLEFGWIRQHVAREVRHGLTRSRADSRVLQLCRRRGRGEPLQYILGTQPFGPLDLLCRRGVLIPRPEPEAYSLSLAELLLKETRGSAPKSTKTPAKPGLTILDACTGTGCIALLLYAQLRKRAGVHVVGIDVASKAVALARDNAARNGLVADGRDRASSASSLSFVQCDLFADGWLADPVVQRLTAQRKGLDVLVSNPPYISTDGFARDTARSVRLFEPKLAQVPLAGGADVFYDRLLVLAQRLDARIVLCEVGDLAQAERVVAAALSSSQKTLLDVEIWADSPDIPAPDERSVVVRGRTVPIRGSGRGRSVFLRRR